MNYSLSKKKAKELVEAKLSHFMGVSPRRLPTSNTIRLLLLSSVT